MDSLLASYASSDEEQDEIPNGSSFPQPKPSSNPVPLSNQQSAKSSLFSSLPQPKTLAPPQSVSNTPKRVVQFKPPINPAYAKPADFDDEDEDDAGEKARKQQKESESLAQTSNVKSFLSSIPAPRNSSTLGVLPSSAGSGRRAIVDTEAPPPNLGDSGIDVSASASYEQVSDQNGGSYVDYDGYSSYELGTNQEFSQNVATEDYGSYESYSGYENYGQNGSSWSSESNGLSDIPFKRQGKRGRNENPIEIIEVKQDELTKDRPRADQGKLTGIAFGPSYQPAASSKGKPSKLHKRKHQIGTLYFDMKQKETELSERRAKGFLTKAQTQAKYGW